MSVVRTPQGTNQSSATARTLGLTLLAVVMLLGSTRQARGGDAIFLPLRWCALENTPAVTNPMSAPANPYTGQPEPDTNNVLWRRHERASDRILIPGANISFRSGITQAVRDQAGFPIIADPCPPTNVTLCQGGQNGGRQCTPDAMGGAPNCGAGVTCATQACPAACTQGCPGQLGDVVAPDTTFCQGGPNNGALCNAAMSNCGMGIACAQPAGHLDEYNLVVSACNDAWDALANRFNTTLLGEIAVNIGVWRSPNGTRTGLKGRAQSSTINGNTCAIPPTGVTTATGGAMLGIDNQNFTNGVAGEVNFEQTNERMVAHELGHTLFLWHGDGVDNDNNNAYDQVCDGGENTCATPLTFMSSTMCMALSTSLTGLQRDTSRAVASVYTGVTRDPPGSLINGPNVGDQRTDTPVDVVDRGIDIVRLTIQNNVDVARTSFSHVLFGTIEFSRDPERQYVVFADLDGNPATGGAPATLGFATTFVGAELVTRVVVGFAGEFAFFDPTVWRFQAGSFAECTPDSDPLCKEIAANVLNVFGGDDGGSGDGPTVDAHVVTIEMPDAIRGPMGQDVRFQALAQQLSSTIPAANLQLDRLPDEPLDGAKILRPVAPVFPECLVTPDPVAPGGRGTVEARGLFADRMVKVILGDDMVGGGLTDTTGSARVEFPIPIDSRAGLRLVTVGVVGTALTADCRVEVQQGPPLILTPEFRTNRPGESHTVTATVRAVAGTPQSGVAVRFSVLSGPNLGTSGACSPNVDCTTDVNGVARFTYTGAGGLGVDRISASIDGGSAPVVSNEALKFWDEDCNENAIADPCDVDCGAFETLCARVVGCGMSADADRNRIPDECRPPLKRFLCYAAHHGPFDDILGVALDDEFGPGIVDARKARRFCTPANVDGGDPAASSNPHHLTGYPIKQTDPHFDVPVKDQVVVNEFGTIAVDVRRPELMLVPTAQSLVSTPPAPVAPPVDHFKCYRVTGARTRVADLTIEDQFGTLTVDIKKPTRLCVPADKDGEGIVDSATHLMCYQVRLASGSPSFEPAGQLFINNQFGPDTIGSFRATELCVPSRTNP